MHGTPELSLPPMSSSSTLRHPDTYTGMPWRPWSIPVDLPGMHRTMCGLLNKVTQANLDSLSHKMSILAIAVERTGDPHILETFVRSIYQHALTDSRQTKVYVGMCQKIVDELEEERNLWRKVDVFHLGNPMDCFETSLRVLSQFEFKHVYSTKDSQLLCTFAGFVGELLAEELIFPGDVDSMIRTLFADASQNAEGSASALYRFVTRVTNSFQAIQLLTSLGIVDKVEELLTREDTLSPKVKYTMRVSLRFLPIHRPKLTQYTRTYWIKSCILDHRMLSPLAAIEVRSMVYTYQVLAAKVLRLWMFLTRSTYLWTLTDSKLTGYYAVGMNVKHQLTSNTFTQSNASSSSLPSCPPLYPQEIWLTPNWWPHFSHIATSDRGATRRRLHKDSSPNCPLWGIPSLTFLKQHAY